jgi:hypothetical protein
MIVHSLMFHVCMCAASHCPCWLWTPTEMVATFFGITFAICFGVDTFVIFDGRGTMVEKA